MSNGYVKIYRSLAEKGYYKDSNYVHLWVHLIMKATYQDKEFLFNNKIEYLTPGQFITGRNSLVKETGINRSKVERILKCFENEHQIEQQTNNKFRIITILNWNEYQQSEQQKEQPVSNQRAASEQPVSTNNKEKKDKKEYSVDFLSFWSAYPKKTGSKKTAFENWKKLNGDKPEIGIILAAIKSQTEWREKSNGEFRPEWKDPERWIKGKMWEVELDKPEVKSSW
jgi:hypothetical protein